MKFNLLYSTPFSLSFELDNNDIYVTNSYDVYLNDEIILKDYKKMYLLYLIFIHLQNMM